jgi:Zn-dependent peptidase ImmA (M78 family)
MFMDKRAFTLPKQLIRRYQTRDPFTIAEERGIQILMRSDFKSQKGAFVVLQNISFIFINANLSEHMQRLVCAHELGHALLHRTLGKNVGGVMEFEIFDIKDDTEYDANVFAANLLIDEEEVLEMAREGYDVVHIAKELNLNVNILLVKLNEMSKNGYDLRGPSIPGRKFLGSISDDVGSL